METILEQHRRALAHCVRVVAGVREDDLSGTTPCRGWDLADLLGHMVGQNEGFAEAVIRAGRPPGGGRAARGGVRSGGQALGGGGVRGGGQALGGGGVRGGGQAGGDRVFGVEGFLGSVERVREAFAGASGQERVLLPEVSPEVRWPLEVVVGMHLLDTLVHTWDVARSLGDGWRPPEPDLVAAALEQALRVPGGERRTRPGAPFAPARAEIDDDDDWARALRLLGRDPG